MRSTIVLAVGGLALAATDSAAQTPESIARCQAQPPQWQALCFDALRQQPPVTPPPPKPKVVAKPAPAPAPAPKLAPVEQKAEVDGLKPLPGQPLCVDQDSLATLLKAGALAKNGAITRGQLVDASSACQTIPQGSRVDILERLASGSNVIRMVKVRVTAPSLRGPTVGYTIEVDEVDE